MKTLRILSLSLTILLAQTVSFAQINLTFYGFDKDFVAARYPADSAISDLSATAFHPAHTIHSISCGGNDGELHIGISLNEAKLSSDLMPLTDSLTAHDSHWGFVAELPNAASGNGPSLLNSLTGKTITFQGYFRVWDEGHAEGDAPVSNPHHVFEIHPAWGFKGTGVNFFKPQLIFPMSDFSGFGFSKFKSLLEALDGGEWPLAFQDNKELHVGIPRGANFHQLPVEVTAIKVVTGGHEVTVDVFSDKAHKNRVYSGLACITAKGSAIDTGLTVGQSTFLLGFFSVNLRKALDGSHGATSEGNAKVVKEAVEFFVFGIAPNPAVKSCS